MPLQFDEKKIDALFATSRYNFWHTNTKIGREFSPVGFCRAFFKVLGDDSTSALSLLRHRDSPQSQSGRYEARILSVFSC